MTPRRAVPDGRVVERSGHPAEQWPLAEAKLAAPRQRAGLVDRPRILRALDAGAETALTLVAAPPGFGKSTAVRAWCANRSTAHAWVTVDARDNDPVRLWTYVASAVDRIRPGLGRATLMRLRATAAVASPIDELLNAIAGLGAELVIVLDDLQTVTDGEALASIDYAVEHLPANARVIAITRIDPRSSWRGCVPAARSQSCARMSSRSRSPRRASCSSNAAGRPSATMRSSCCTNARRDGPPRSCSGQYASLDRPVLLLAHPRLVSLAERHGLTLEQGSIRVCPPLAYPQLVNAVLNSAGVVTDSGGLQKEAFLLRVPCTTIRPETEWVETLESQWNVLVSEDLSILADTVKRPAPEPTDAAPYGDGTPPRRSWTRC